jgi:hypothetical protein
MKAIRSPISELFDGAKGPRGKSRSIAQPLTFDPEAFRLAEAFVKISDKGLRSSLVDVAEAMARKSNPRN